MWREPDQFEWVTAFLRERNLLVNARAILATVAATAGLVPLAVLLGQRHPTAPLLVSQSAGIALTCVMAVYWSKRWPSRRQSRAAMLGGLSCIALWSQAQSNAAMAAQICMAAAITGGYAACLHSSRLLTLNFAVALVIGILTCVRLHHVTGVAEAAGAFWLILFVNMSVPLAIRGLTRALGMYATRSGQDPLTGLLNRRAFTEKLLARMLDIPETDTHLIVLLVDLDDFKRINDTHGHAAGDGLLKAVAGVLRHHLAGSATVCRAGGEEFLAAYTCASADPTTVSHRLCTAIAALTPSVTASIGVTSTAMHTAPQPVTAGFVDELVEIADQAMYAAKRGGGNSARLHSTVQ